MFPPPTIPELHMSFPIERLLKWYSNICYRMKQLFLLFTVKLKFQKHPLKKIKTMFNQNQQTDKCEKRTSNIDRFRQKVYFGKNHKLLSIWFHFIHFLSLLYMIPSTPTYQTCIVYLSKDFYPTYVFNCLVCWFSLPFSF